MEFVEVSEARGRGGLRLVVVGGLPSPWSEAAKGILHVKRIPFVAVRMRPGDAELQEWTGANNAPVAVYEDERPRTGWAEILLLAERLAPEPRLVPAVAAERAWMMGLSHEICGEMGLGWCRRLEGVHACFDSGGERGFPRPIAEYLAGKYGYRPGSGAEVQRRVCDVLGLLAGRLHDQRRSGSRYLLGGSLTALDVYSAAFMATFAPLPADQCPMPEPLRAVFETLDEPTRRALDPILLEHRDFVYGEHLELPLQL